MLATLGSGNQPIRYKGLKMMRKLLKAAIVIAAIAGYQTVTVSTASANGAGVTSGGLLQYSHDPATRKAMPFKPFKVASRRSRRRNRVIAGAAVAGIAALILSEAIRSRRDRDYYYDDDYYSYRSSYPGYRKCNRWAYRCDYGNRRACRKWNRRCR